MNVDSQISQEHRDDLVNAEVDAQAARDSPWHERRCDSVLWLDSAVSALTLGNEGIVRPQLRVHLQPVSVAAVYILVPRSTSDASCREEKDNDVWERALALATSLPDTISLSTKLR